MIIADFIKRNGKLIGFSVGGHSGFADRGEDVVCASVSSAVQLTANTMTECFGIKAKVKVSGNKIQLELPSYEETGEKLIKGLYMHLEIISEEYEGTIKITTSEV